MLYAFAPVGYHGELVRVESDLRRGVPGMDIVGLATGAVKEARDRVRVALRASGWAPWEGRILVSLSPADLRKNGGGYDLAIALSLLEGMGHLQAPPEPLAAVGELGLDGHLRPVPGVLAAALLAAERGLKNLLVPACQAAEGAGPSGLKVWPVERLEQIPEVYRSIHQGGSPPQSSHKKRAPHRSGKWELRGQPGLLRALTLAAAGGHHILLVGPPGTGKTLAAHSLALLQPPPSEAEELDVNRIASLAGLWNPDKGWLSERPFREVSPGASLEGLTGGGSDLKPGEMTLAHTGVLFLDEVLEFSGGVLQALRGPSQEGRLHLARAGRNYQFPASFQLVMTANPCPCGRRGLPQAVCLCSEAEVHQYWKTLGGPLLDRVDIRAVTRPQRADHLLAGRESDLTELRERVRRAWERQAERNTEGRRNARLSPSEIAQYCRLVPGDADWLAKVAQKLGLSGRAVHGILKAARTGADLEGKGEISRSDLTEALRLRWFGEQSFRDEPLAEGWELG